MNSTFKRTLAAMLAVLMIACSFASCKKEPQEEEITRGENAIVAPETTAAATEASTAVSATEATTAAAATTKKPSTPPAQKPADEKVENIANQSGLNVKFVENLIRAFGFSYDTNEGVFYTEVNSWQRSANYIKHYDMLAPFGNMTYVTTKIDFKAENVDWRLQFWKGQYGPFGGAELGVYYKYPGKTDELYYCADDSRMLYMAYDLYLTPDEYWADLADGKLGKASNRRFFRRGWQKHWWLTGFKPANVNPQNLVLIGRMRFFDLQMRSAAEKGFEAAGFKKGDAKTQMDTYRSSGHDIYFLWHKAGMLNYQ